MKYIFPPLILLTFHDNIMISKHFFGFLINRYKFYSILNCLIDCLLSYLGADSPPAALRLESETRKVALL
jgi:hypothetical protein